MVSACTLTMRERRRGAFLGCSFIFAEVHPFDQAMLKCIRVPDYAVRKHLTSKALHELMDFYVDCACSAVDNFHDFNVRIELLPLPGPVRTYLILPNDPPAFRRLRPADALTHLIERSIDIAFVESRLHFTD